MKFEEVLPSLREGKKIKRKNAEKDYWLNDSFISNDINNRTYDTILIEDLLADDWEIVEEPKKKFKYYPALYQFKNSKRYRITGDVYKHFNECPEHPGQEFIRLITEIPELIEEREE